MIALIVGTHGMFSKELVKSAEMIFGEQKNIGYVTFVPGEGTENLISKYDEIIKELDALMEFYLWLIFLLVAHLMLQACLL